MKLIVKWDEPTLITGRTYVKGCMKFKDDNMISDIYLANDDSMFNLSELKIGKCRMISDEVGLWATDIQYSVDEKALNELLTTCVHSRGTTDLSLSCNGTVNNDMINQATFNCLRHHVFTNIDLKYLFRDLKLAAFV